MGKLVLEAALAYLKEHPEVVGQLIGEGITALTNALKNHNAAQTTPATPAAK